MFWQFASVFASHCFFRHFIYDVCVFLFMDFSTHFCSIHLIMFAEMKGFTVNMPDYMTALLLNISYWFHYNFRRLKCSIKKKTAVDHRHGNISILFNGFKMFLFVRSHWWSLSIFDFEMCHVGWHRRHIFR